MTPASKGAQVKTGAGVAIGRLVILTGREQNVLGQG